MKIALLLGLWLGVVSVTAAQRVLAEYDWRQLSQSDELPGGVPATLDGRQALKITNPTSTALQLRLLKIMKPPISKTVYAVVGEIKYDAVRGDGYLELWNYFAPIQSGMSEGQYFSRTLGASGPMGKITGTSKWRPFMLPFNRSGASGPPTRLELNIHLPGPGTVHIGPVELVECEGEDLSAAMSVPGAWWSERTARLIGGIAGAILGCLGGLLTWLASKGKARLFVVITSWILIAAGGVCALMGIVALSMRQPYAVWFVLLLGGVLLLGILPFRLRRYQRQYEDLELRRMVAVDAMKG